jgi:hypothetical protein
VWFKHRAWIAVAWVLSLANVGAVWFAAQPGEAWHATTHAALAVLFGFAAERLRARKTLASSTDAVRSQELEARLANPQQLAEALDAIAVEVERIGEGQRYLTKLLSERDARSPDAVRPPKPPTG